jgi:hypothetical protein
LLLTSIAVQFANDRAIAKAKASAKGGTLLCADLILGVGAKPAAGNGASIPAAEDNNVSSSLSTANASAPSQSLPTANGKF